ncbi:DUF3298 domain-containing protein [Panacibacter sp. DH6]|uniref:DUF3298 domain-containing protein n=1 Tax=Panacibacter microcysteis TaxID=2793269 RepID=A0A931MEL3_9BACT|nr:DUF3298 and DUF4163 domain-containing protein [Panacibacter microcysteis]MBG9378339.1 DUF3298 domain-containing protein [Panacibacter microcysteis]
MKNVFPFLFALMLFACGPANDKQNPGNDTAAVENITADTVVYSYNTVNRKETNATIKDTGFLYHATITYPVISTTGVLADSINKALRAGLFNNKPTAEAFADSFVVRPTDMGNYPAMNSWFYNAHADVLINTPKLFVVRFDIGSYTGGAHGSAVTVYYNFDKTGKQLTWNEVIEAGKKDTLVKISEAALRKAKEIPATQSWNQAGFFIDSSHLPLPAAFGFDKTGLLMTYNQYEVAPYASGIMSYTIPYSQLEGVIKKEWMP